MKNVRDFNAYSWTNSKYIKKSNALGKKGQQRGKKSTQIIKLSERESSCWVWIMKASKKKFKMRESERLEIKWNNDRNSRVAQLLAFNIFPAVSVVTLL